MSSWKRADVVVAHAAPAAYELHDLASRHSQLFPDYVTFSWCGHQRVRSLSPDATRRSLLPITAAFAGAKICCVIRAPKSIFEVDAKTFTPGLYTCQVNVIDATASQFSFSRLDLYVRAK